MFSINNSLVTWKGCRFQLLYGPVFCFVCQILICRAPQTRRVFYIDPRSTGNAKRVSGFGLLWENFVGVHAHFLFQHIDNELDVIGLYRCVVIPPPLSSPIVCRRCKSAALRPFKIVMTLSMRAGSVGFIFFTSKFMISFAWSHAILCPSLPTQEHVLYFDQSCRRAGFKFMSK